MKLIKHLALMGALAATVSIAHADIVQYDLTNVTTSAGSLTGFVDINTATDNVTSASITFNDTALGSPVFTNIGGPTHFNGIGQDFISGPSTGSLNFGGQIALYYDTVNIGTSANLGICILNGPCGSPSSSQTTYSEVFTSSGSPMFDITGGTLDLHVNTVSATPEPSSLVLLGTGLLGFAGMARRRFVKA